MVFNLGKLALGSIRGRGEWGAGGEMIGTSRVAFRRLVFRPFTSESRFRLLFELSLLLLPAIDGLIFTFRIRRGLLGSEEGEVTSWASPFTGVDGGLAVEGEEGGSAAGSGGVLVEVGPSACEVFKRPCHDLRSFFAR